MANEPRPDEEVAEEILGVLRDDASETPADLPDKTIRKVRALITTRDLIDLTTFVFVLIAQWFVRRQVDRLDWLEGTKVKE